MALEMFLRLDGVEGSSRNYHHQGWADIASWKWGMKRERIRDGEKIRDVTRLDEIALVKAVGAESPAMMVLCAGGTRIASGELSIVPVVGKREAQRKYLVMTFENIIIRAITTGGTTEDSFLSEEVALRFASVRYDFFEPQRADAAAGAEVDAHTFQWNPAAGTGS